MAKKIEAIDKTVKAMADKKGKYLTFVLAGEEYGIEITKVREIIGMLPLRSIPQTPDFVKGVINLRGKVIPVTDLRLKFGLDAIDYTKRTCIIVIEVAGQAGDTLMGAVVDSVSEVLHVKAENIEEVPTLGTRLNTDYILGMAKVETGVKILLDIETVLSGAAVGYDGEEE